MTTMLIENKETSMNSNLENFETELALLEASDTSAFPPNTSEDEIMKRATNNMDLLLASLFRLAKSQGKVGKVTLPKQVTVLPRQKPLPRKKPETRWEKFAKEKGINKKKRERLVLDEETGEYVPRWGGRSAQNNKKVNWVEELKEGDDPTVDKFIEKREKKKLRVLKNERNRLKNIERGIEVAQTATGSLGKFDERRKDEPKMRKRKVQKGRNEEISDNLSRDKKILESVLNKA
eukprot:snap_masked-scaffold_11-processed-gene-0.5-mRNA-1 protein AED:0.13 eAED:0.13 QI:0/-1/0/1/-1/1/1/0/234